MSVVQNPLSNDHFINSIKLFCSFFDCFQPVASMKQQICQPFTMGHNSMLKLLAKWYPQLSIGLELFSVFFCFSATYTDSAKRSCAVMF